MEKELRKLLNEMVNEINGYNANDMLGGYLNEMADNFNETLQKLGIKALEKYNED